MMEQLSHIDAIKELIRRCESEMKHYESNKNSHNYKSFQFERRGLLTALDVLEGNRKLFKCK